VDLPEVAMIFIGIGVFVVAAGTSPRW